MKRTIFFFSFLIIYSFVSCSSLEDPDEVKPSDILEISVNGLNQLRTYGRDQTTIIARVPKDAGRIDITFKTTAGIFTFSGAKEIKVFADSVSEDYRYAQTILKTDSTIGTAYITAEIPQARRRLAIPFIE